MARIFSRAGLTLDTLNGKKQMCVSTITKKALNLVVARQLQTKLYHPQADMLLKTSTGTLKTMFRRDSSEVPETGTKTLIECCLPIKRRNCEFQSSLYELLYGTNDGTKTVLGKRTGQTQSHDVTVRAATTDPTACDLQITHEDLSKPPGQDKFQCDMKTHSGNLEAGNRVLVLLPTSPNKLLQRREQVKVMGIITDKHY